MTLYITKDLQARIDALANAEVLDIDGMSGPATRAAVKAAMAKRGVKKESHLFHESGLHRINWHWTAGRNVPSADDLKHYNDVFDHLGNQYDGAARPEHQANYNWRKGIGVSHTKSCNTGVIGQAVAGMHGAEGWPSLEWGNHPITWEGIDAMLERSAMYGRKFDIPCTPWSMMTHAEVQETMGIKQNNKWDYMVLPGDTKVRPAREVGDVLRARLVERFQ